MRRLEKQQAIKLRLQGKSYNEIKKILNIPSKGTLSYWFKNINLPDKAKKKLARNMELARQRGLLRYNNDRTKAILLENKHAHEEARKTIGTLSKRELLLVGAALYWGEGTKIGKNYSSNAIALSNSSPNLIAVFMRFIREILEIPEEKIRGGIQIHPNINSEEAKKFWSKITNLPKERFYTFQQVNRASRQKRSASQLPYGTISVRVNKRTMLHKILGYITGIYDNI